MEIKRDADGTFQCKCDKKFKLPTSLRRHAKNCGDELAESEENEEEEMLMDIDDADGSESSNTNDRVVPADCFGLLIPYEKR